MHQMIGITRALTFVLLFALSLCRAEAAAVDAKTFITEITGQLQLALRDARGNGKLQDQRHLDQLIDRYVIPHIDAEALCSRIFRRRWQDIIAENKRDQAYTAVFSSLKRTYRLALSAYTGQAIEIKQGKVDPRYSVVRILIHTDNGVRAIDFATHEKGQEWRVFDISIDGVVVTQTLNGSIQRTLEAGDVDSLIQAIDAPQPAAKTP